MIYKLINDCDGCVQNQFMGYVDLESKPDIVSYNDEIYNVRYESDRIILVSYVHFERIKVVDENTF